MEYTQLYNIDTDTLVSLNLQNMLVEVRHDFSQIYHIDKEKFLALYVLFLSHPHMLYYTEIIELISNADVKISKPADLRKLVKDLKAEISTYGIKKLIVEIKNTGYAISNKWVRPTQISEHRDTKLVNYIKRMCRAAAI